VKCLVNAYAKSRLTLEPADTPARRQGPGRSLPGPDAGHPLQGAGGHAVVFMIRNMCGMVSAAETVSDVVDSIC
jgi:hypothetical protein